MWCLLVLLCSQGIAFSAGFTAAFTPGAETSHCKKSRDPECFMNVSEIIRYHGFPSEEYEVTTEDGYILGVFRIPAGRNSQNTGKKPAVLLHHGVLGDATHWIGNLPNNSLGFILADAGYDVWLGNSRGVTWSLKHKTFKPCQKEFWQFSFDEIGKYDIPAELNFIMNKTGQKCLYYIGHSEGSAIGNYVSQSSPSVEKFKHVQKTEWDKPFLALMPSLYSSFMHEFTFMQLAGFIAFSTYPDLSQKIKAFFALAPVVTTTHATSPLVTFTQLPQSLIRSLLGCKGVLLNNELLKGLVTQFCACLGKVCGSIFCYLGGGRIQNVNTDLHSFILSQHWTSAFITLLLCLQSRMDSYTGHYPTATSVQNVIHWHQILRADQFQAFDYGCKENMKKYNQTAPPVYKIEEIKTPIAVWSGGQDKFADPKDMARLLPQITNLIYHENFPAWGHLDFIWGMDATEKMYMKIIELLKKYA